MSCHDFEGLVALHVEGDLDVAERRQLESHLLGCAACRQLAEDLKDSQSAFKSMRQDVPDEATLLALRTRVLGDVAGMHPGNWFDRWFFNGFRQTATLAGIALLLVGGWVAWPSHPGEVPVGIPPVPVAENSPPAPIPEPLPEPASPVRAVKPRVSARKPVPVSVPVAVSVSAPVPVPVEQEPRQQVTIKLLTDDPTVIIYWLGDEKGD